MARQSIGGQRMHVILTAQQMKALDKYSRQTGLTRAEHVRRAVDFYLAKAAATLSKKPE